MKLYAKEMTKVVSRNNSSLGLALGKRPSDIQFMWVGGADKAEALPTMHRLKLQSPPHVSELLPWLKCRRVRTCALPARKPLS